MGGLSQGWQIIVKSLKTGYEHLGSVILINVIWFFIWLSPLFLISLFLIENLALFIIGFILSLTLFGPATGGAYALIKQIIEGTYRSISEYKKVFLKYFWRSLFLVLVCGLMLLFILLNIFVCIESSVFLFRFIGGIWLYVLLFWFIMMQYVFPLLVQQNIGILTIIKRAALLALDNILLSLIILLAGLLITFISVAFVVPFVILWLSLLGLMQHYAFVQVLAKYGDGNGK